MNKRFPFFYGWVIVGIAAVTMTLVYGVRHSCAVFFPSILDQFGWSRGSTAVMLSIHIFVYGAVAPLSGRLGDRWRPRRVMPTGVLILGLAAASCSLANQLWHFYLIFGVFAPIGLACCGWPLISPTLANWFTKHRGLAVSIGQMGGGLSFVYGMFAEYVISHFGWRTAYVVMGAVLIVILLPLLIIFFFYHPREKGLKPFGMELSETKPSKGQESTKPEYPDWTLRKAIRTYQLWLLVLSQFFFWGVGCYLLLGHQVKFAEDVGYSGMFAASIFALFGIFMVAGQLCSSVSDRIGREVTVTLSSVLVIGALFALISVTDASKPWLLYLYAFGFGFGVGLYSPTVFVGAADIFHGRHFGVINGLLLAGLGFGGAIGPWIGGYIYDLSGSYRFAFGLSMLSFALGCATFVAAAPRNAAKIIQRASLF